VRIWDAISGNACVVIEIASDDYAVWNEDSLLCFASPGAWQWLGWQTIVDGKTDWLPAELFGSLPVPPNSNS